MTWTIGSIDHEEAMAVRLAPPPVEEIRNGLLALSVRVVSWLGSFGIG